MCAGWPGCGRHCSVTLTGPWYPLQAIPVVRSMRPACKAICLLVGWRLLHNVHALHSHTLPLTRFAV